MRLFSEEFNTGSYELLLTLPVSSLNIILGKFLAAAAFAAIMLLPTIFYAIFISFLGDLDWGPVIGGYIGAVLMGAAFSAIGLFASSITRNQIIAFIAGMSLCFLLTLLDKILFFSGLNQHLIFFSSLVLIFISGIFQRGSLIQETFCTSSASVL